MNNLRHRRWAYNLPLASYFHARDSYIPPRDDLLGSQLELETRPLQAVVEHLVVLLQTSFIVDLQIFITKLNIMKIWVIEYKIKRMQNRKAKHFFSTKKNFGNLPQRFCQAWLGLQSQSLSLQWTLLHWGSSFLSFQRPHLDFLSWPLASFSQPFVFLLVFPSVEKQNIILLIK